ncbi:hypothetical protein BDW22DRAFT_520613 [Trametopsis cervina]|nr:hypothetical protein BDW22DRAFT_520613 [Trametopsis cervina]
MLHGIPEESQTHPRSRGFKTPLRCVHEHEPHFQKRSALQITYRSCCFARRRMRHKYSVTLSVQPTPIITQQTKDDASSIRPPADITDRD